MLTWELAGAVVGAGLASGREIASFFAQYGVWSWSGIMVAVGMMVFLADAHIPQSWEKRWPEALWHMLLKLLMIATGGAMLSGTGEITSLILPYRSAYWIGIAGTLLLAWNLAHRMIGGLACVSRILLGILALLLVLGMILPPMRAANIGSSNVLEALMRGTTYGGFNAALQVPIITLAADSSASRRKLACLCAGIMILSLLLVGNALLLRHTALLGEAMPYVKMLTHFGKFGYGMGVVCLYLAILSTLTASLRGLGRHPVYVVCMIISALLGFAGVVEVLYPLLGGGCFLILAAAKFLNYAQSSFISKRDVI